MFLWYLYSICNTLLRDIFWTLLRFLGTKWFLDTLKLCLSSSYVAIPFDVSTPRDNSARKYRELATIITISESL